MYAIQIRSLCVESQKLLLKQLEDLDLLQPQKPNKTEPVSDIEALDDEEIVEEVHLEEAAPEIYSVEGDSEVYTVVELEDDLRPPVEVPKKRSRANSTYEICELCGKRYTKNYISTHLRTHRDDDQKVKSYGCEF